MRVTSHANGKDLSKEIAALKAQLEDLAGSMNGTGESLVARGEGLPVAALEALAAGLPVVLGRECRLPEVAASGAGLVVDGSVPEIASALERVVLAPDGGAGMGARARLLASERFSWPAIVAQLDGIYSGVERAPGSDA